MISSYRFSQEHNFHSLLWDGAGVLCAGIRCLAAVVGRTPQVISHFAPILYGWLFLLWTDALAIACGVAVVGSWAAVIALGLGALVFVLAHPAVIVGAGIIAAYAWAFKPRTAVRL